MCVTYLLFIFLLIGVTELCSDWNKSFEITGTTLTKPNKGNITSTCLSWKSCRCNFAHSQSNKNNRVNWNYPGTSPEVRFRLFRDIGSDVLKIPVLCRAGISAHLAMAQHVRWGRTGLQSAHCKVEHQTKQNSLEFKLRVTRLYTAWWSSSSVS